MKEHISIICLIMSIILYFFYNMMDNTVYFVGGTLFALPGVAGLLQTRNNDFRTFALIVFGGSLLDIIATSYGVGGSVVFIVCCGITYLCLMHLKIFFITSLVICILLIIFLYYQLFIVGTINGDIFLQYGLSKNYPGSMLVIFNCLWAVWKYLHYKKMPLVLPIISTVMCFFLDGRSSLICSVMITIFCFVVRGRKLTFIMAIISVLLLIRFGSYLYGYYELTALAEKGMDTARTEIWNSYLDNLDFSTFLFGLDTQQLPILKHYGGNPHNSFLSVHRRMGLLGISAVFFYLVKAFRLMIIRKQYVIMFFISVLLLRMFFDGMLVTAEDFFILTLFFIPICYDSSIFNIDKQLQTKGNTWIEKMSDKIFYLL